MDKAINHSNNSVPFREKIALGVGSLSAMFGYVGVSTLAYPIYNMMMGVDTALIAMALMIPRIWDAITDPVMGRISDSFKSKYGRRKPFIILGAISMGLTFGLIWIAPEYWTETQKIAYFIIMQILFFTAYTVFAVPYTALSYEMTPDYNEKNRVMAYNAFFHKLGEFLYQWMVPLATFISISILASDKLSIEGFQYMAWIVGIGIMSLFGVIPGFFVKERYANIKPSKDVNDPGFMKGILQAFSSKAFLILSSVVILNTLAGVLASGIDHYILIYYMADGDITLGSVWKGMLSSGYAIVGFISIPIINYLANLFGKKGSLYFVYTLMVIGGISKMFIFTPGHHIYELNLFFTSLKVDPIIMIDPILCGPMWVAVKIMLASMMADICDEDELKHGQRREGVFGAVFSWVEKSAVSLSFLGAGLALKFSAFDIALGHSQSPDTFLKMRLFLSGAPTLTAIFAIVSLYFYPITAERAQNTTIELEKRRKASEHE